MLTSLSWSLETVVEGVFRCYWALVDPYSTIGPVVSVLKKTMPVLDTTSSEWMSSSTRPKSYDGGRLAHRGIRETINDVDAE